MSFRRAMPRTIWTSHPYGKRLYLADKGGRDVIVIDLAKRKIIKCMLLGPPLYGVDITPIGKYAFVISIGGKAVNVVDTETLEISSRSKWA